MRGQRSTFTLRTAAQSLSKHKGTPITRGVAPPSTCYLRVPVFRFLTTYYPRIKAYGGGKVMSERALSRPKSEAGFMLTRFS